MPRANTEATELSVAFGILNIDPNCLSTGQIKPSFQDTLTLQKYQRYKIEYSKKNEYYDQFIEVGKSLRRSYPYFNTSSISSLRWEGPKQQASTGSVARDLVVGNTSISVKADSHVVINSSPHNLFISTPQCQAPQQDSQDWYWFVAPDEYQEFYSIMRNQSDSTLPLSVLDFNKNVKGKHRKKLGKVFQDCFNPNVRADMKRLYLKLCHTVAQRSAERFNSLYESARTGPAKASVEESIIRTFFRVDTQEYILCGLENREPHGLLIPDLATWKQKWRLKDLSAVADIDRGQSVVEFILNVQNKSTKALTQLRYHAQIRWAHGKLGSCPEAKLYKGGKGKPWKWSDVPFFTKLFSSVDSSTKQVQRYKFVDEIGHGGFGTIWKVRLNTSQEEVALKELSNPNLTTNELSRFAREVKNQSSLNHQNIMPILESGLEAFPPWFTMPIAQGSLAGQINSLQGNFSQIDNIFSQLLSGMAFAHKNSVIHRDLKPENVLIFDGDKVKISDFGLSKKIETSTETSSLTRSGSFIGSVEYASPEQLSDMKVADKRSDIYSLGKLLYVMLTGEKPFPKLTLSLVPQKYRHVIEKCTDDNPNNRFHSIEALTSAFMSISSNQEE